MSFAVDDNGFGKVNVNGKTYKVHSKPEYSGGIACSKAYGLDLAEIDCIIPWTGDFDLSEIPANETRSCFDNERLAVEANFLTVSKRQGGGNGGCLPGAATGLVDDGDPHQNYFHKQITVSSSGSHSSYFFSRLSFDKKAAAHHSNTFAHYSKTFSAATVRLAQSATSRLPRTATVGRST